MEDTVNDLLRSLKITAGARFNAGKRLEHHDRRLTMLTATASSYVIALTILPYFIQLPKNTTDYLNLMTVLFSVVILVSSLLQYSSSNTVRAEQFHRSALEINELRRELLRKAKNISEDDFLDISKRYNLVLHKYSINHDDIDFARYQLERKHDFPWLCWNERQIMHLEQIMNHHAANIALVIMSLIMGWIVFYYALPSALTK